jgi:hypothetical protein
MDLSDGSYDNAPVDLKLRSLLAQCRQINIGVNHWFGVKLFKRVSGWTHDFINLLRIRWRQVKDYLRAGLYTVAIPAAIAGVGVGGWYMYKQGGFLKGLSALGGDLGDLGKKLWKKIAG